MGFQRDTPEMNRRPLQRHVARHSIHSTYGDDEANDTHCVQADQVIEPLLLPIRTSNGPGMINFRWIALLQINRFYLDNQNAKITVKTNGGATSRRVTVGL
jgi:hypothetical protein